MGSATRARASARPPPCCVLNPGDIVLSRARPAITYEGTKWYRALIASRAVEYQKARKARDYHAKKKIREEIAQVAENEGRQFLCLPDTPEKARAVCEPANNCTVDHEHVWFVAYKPHVMLKISVALTLFSPTTTSTPDEKSKAAKPKTKNAGNFKIGSSDDDSSYNRYPISKTSHGNNARARTDSNNNSTYKNNSSDEASSYIDPDDDSYSSGLHLRQKNSIQHVLLEPKKSAQNGTTRKRPPAAVALDDTRGKRAKTKANKNQNSNKNNGNDASSESDPDDDSFASDHRRPQGIQPALLKKKKSAHKGTTEKGPPVASTLEDTRVKRAKTKNSKNHNNNGDVASSESDTNGDNFASDRRRPQKKIRPVLLKKKKPTQKYKVRKKPVTAKLPRASTLATTTLKTHVRKKRSNNSKAISLENNEDGDDSSYPTDELRQQDIQHFLLDAKESGRHGKVRNDPAMAPLLNDSLDTNHDARANLKSGTTPSETDECDALGTTLTSKKDVKREIFEVMTKENLLKQEVILQRTMALTRKIELEQVLDLQQDLENQLLIERQRRKELHEQLTLSRSRVAQASSAPLMDDTKILQSAVQAARNANINNTNSKFTEALQQFEEGATVNSILNPDQAFTQQTQQRKQKPLNYVSQRKAAFDAAASLVSFTNNINPTSQPIVPKALLHEQLKLSQPWVAQASAVSVLGDADVLTYAVQAVQNAFVKNTNPNLTEVSRDLDKETAMNGIKNPGQVFSHQVQQKSSTLIDLPGDDGMNPSIQRQTKTANPSPMKDCQPLRNLNPRLALPEVWHEFTEGTDGKRVLNATSQVDT